MKNISEQIWESALRKLEIRSHSKAELIAKLNAKFPDEQGVVLKVIEEMERVHLLNDRRFTEEFIAHLIQKPIGRLKIMAETGKRGLSDNAVEQALLDAGYCETESAKTALTYKIRVLNETDARKRKHKLINFLKNRGFRDSTIYKTIDQV